MARFGDIAKYRDDVSSTGTFGKLYIKFLGFPHIYLFNTFFHFKVMFKNVNITNGVNILDAGCGKGYFAFWVAKKFSRLNVDVLDICEDSIHFCRKVKEKDRIDNITIMCDDLKNLSFKNKYDFIYCLSVLEHIPNNEIVLNNFYQSLKNEGLLYISMPTGRPLKKYFDQKHYEVLDKWLAEEHIGEYYSVDKLSNILTKIGFTIVKKKTDGSFLPAYAWQANEILFRNNRYKAVAVTYPFLKFIAYIGNIFNLIYDNKRGNAHILAKKAL